MSREVALAGLLGLVPIGLGLLRGGAVNDAAFRAAVLLGLLVVVDRVVLPLVRVVVGPPRDDAG